MKSSNQFFTIRKEQFVKELNSIGEVFLVGGCVRDFLMKSSFNQFLCKIGIQSVQSKDIDLLVCGVAKNQIISICSKFGSINDVGASFGVLKLKLFETDEEIDIALPRTEKSFGDGHKDFAIVADPNLPIEEDLKRRDFSINAIAISTKTGSIVDPFNGQQDLKDKTIRMVSPQSFQEDPLRMIRAIQFAARFDFRLSGMTLISMQQNAQLIKTISKERILIEFQKMVDKAKNLWMGLNLLDISGINTHLGFAPFEGHWSNGIKTLSDLLFFLNQTDDMKFWVDFKCDSTTILELERIGWVMKAKPQSMFEARKMVAGWMRKNKSFTKTKFLSDSRICVAIDEFKKGKFPISVTDLQIDGNQLMAFGLKGKEIGDAQNRLFDLVLDGALQNTNSALVQSVKNNL